MSSLSIHYLFPDIFTRDCPRAPLHHDDDEEHRCIDTIAKPSFWVPARMGMGGHLDVWPSRRRSARQDWSPYLIRRLSEWDATKYHAAEVDAKADRQTPVRNVDAVSLSVCLSVQVERKERRGEERGTS